MKQSNQWIRSNLSNDKKKYLTIFSIKDCQDTVQSNPFSDKEYIQHLSFRVREFHPYLLWHVFYFI